MWIKTPKGITLDRYLDAVRCGAHDAVVEMFRDSDAFFAAVSDGIREAAKALAREREAMSRRQERQEQKSVSYDTSVEPPRGDVGSGPVQP